MKSHIISENRKAKFEFEILDKYVAGVVLLGSEVKSIRENKPSFADSFCHIVGDEIYIKNYFIKESRISFSHDPNRDKKLLLNKKEIVKIKKEILSGMTLIPLKIFVNEKGLIKVEISLAKGKKLYDKRESIKKRETERRLKNL